FAVRLLVVRRGRSAAGTHAAALGTTRLRIPGSVGQHDPHQSGSLGAHIMTTTDQEGFSAAEKAAMKARAAEVRAPKKRMTKAEKAAQARQDVEVKIASYSGSDKEIAQRLHHIITTTAPQLEPRTWYGMPAYALDGQILCFIQDAE